jgi:hypothetical protein
MLVINCILISAFFVRYTDCKKVLHGTNNIRFVITYVSVNVSLTDWLPKASDVIIKCDLKQA